MSHQVSCCTPSGIQWGGGSAATEKGNPNNIHQLTIHMAGDWIAREATTDCET